MDAGLKDKVIIGMMIHTDNWDSNIEEFLVRCAACPYSDTPRDGTSKGCVYNLLNDALTVLRGEPT